MRRILLVLAVAALMAAMVVVMAAPAFADHVAGHPGGPIPGKDIGGPVIGDAMQFCNQEMVTGESHSIFQCHPVTPVS